MTKTRMTTLSSSMVEGKERNGHSCGHLTQVKSHMKFIKRRKNQKLKTLLSFSAAEMHDYCRNTHLKYGRTNRSRTHLTRYCSCKVNGCLKEYRTVPLRLDPELHDPEGLIANVFSVEHVEADLHHHLAEEIVHRGKKRTLFKIFNLCYINGI